MPAILSYATSLALCGAFLIIYQQGQPALLYIVPALLAVTFLQGGLLRGELTLMAKEGIDMLSEVRGTNGPSSSN